MKAGSNGNTWSRPKVKAMLTFSTPAGLPECVVTSAMADWIDSTPSVTDARKRSPSSVRVRLRLLR